MRSDPNPALAWAENILRAELEAEPLAGDGGGRRYYRLRGKGEAREPAEPLGNYQRFDGVEPCQGLVLLQGPDPAENLAWLRLGRHLWFQRLPLPRIHDYDLERGFFLLEDLGDERLADLPLREGGGYYPEAARLLARFHLKGAEGHNPAWGHQRRVYDTQMAAEQEVMYYLKSFIIGYLELSELLGIAGKEARLRPGAVSAARAKARLGRGIISTALRDEALRLGQMAAAGRGARVLMHRDYQGRNLMIRRGRLHIIDWQGARPGPAAYDLSSLMEETPQGPLSEELKAETVAAYLRARGPGAWRKTFGRELTVTGAVRMMQALGAYGRLSSLGKTKFAAYIPPLLQRLNERLKSPVLAAFPRLRRVTEEALMYSEGGRFCLYPAESFEHHGRYGGAWPLRGIEREIPA